MNPGGRRWYELGPTDLEPDDLTGVTAVPAGAAPTEPVVVTVRAAGAGRLDSLVAPCAARDATCPTGQVALVAGSTVIGLADPARGDATALSFPVRRGAATPLARVLAPLLTGPRLPLELTEQP